MKNETPALRKLAEGMLKKNPEAIKELPHKDIQSLIEELHIHQIELEMQNEELRQAQLELEAARDRYSDLYDFAPVGLVTASEKGRILEVNLTGATMLGAARSILIGMPLSKFVTKDDQDAFYFHLKKLYGEKTKQTSELRLVGKDETPFYARIESVIAENTEGNSAQARMSITDTSEQKLAEKALRKSENQYRLVTDALPVLISYVDSQIRYRYINKTCVEWLGHARNEVYGKHVKDIVEENVYERIVEHIEKALSGEFAAFEAPVSFKGGEIRWVRANYIPDFDEQGEVKGFIALIEDMTAIKDALKEKEVLLREIHHRVKNNMQAIISLLRLQSDKIKEKQYADMFAECQNRIKSMSLIHELLYQSKNFADIDFGGYIKRLASGLFVSHGADPGKIRLTVEIENVSLDLDNAIPCGMIINELVSNSLKHAFPRNTEGQIKVNLRALDENAFELNVNDNGVGLPEALDIRNTDTMGLHLVKLLAEHQLGGKIKCTRTGGTRFKIRFKRALYKPRI